MYSKTLYPWLFNYNPFTHKWNAFKREEYVAYFNGEVKGISSSDINTLIEIIGKTNGDITKLKSEQ